MPLFKPIFDSRPSSYCGPAAIAILTGVPLSRIEKMIRRKRKGWKNSLGRKMPIKGTYNWEVRTVLERLGCKVEELKDKESTLARFVDDVRHAGTYLVNVTGHYVTCCAGVIADNTHPDGIPVEAYHRGTRRVQRAWRVIAPALPKYTLDDALVASRPPKPKKDIKVVRLEKTLALIKKWERKEKLAKTKLKKLRSQLKRYQKLGLIGEDK